MGIMSGPPWCTHSPSVVCDYCTKEVKMALHPLGDRVLLKVAPPSESKGLIVIPHRYRQQPQEGEVVAVGPEVHTVQVGQHVLFGRWSVLAVEGHGVLIRERDIMAGLDEV